VAATICIVRERWRGSIEETIMDNAIPPGDPDDDDDDPEDEDAEQDEDEEPAVIVYPRSCRDLSGDA
jgi:hypothetical protein